MPLYRLIWTLLFILPLVACTGSIVAKKQGDGEAIHGGDPVDLALRAARLRLIQAAKGLQNNERISLFGVKPAGCEARYGASLCGALDGQGVDYAKQFLLRNVAKVLFLDDTGSLEFIPTRERMYQTNPDGSQREVLAWTGRGSEGRPAVFFNQEVRSLPAASLLALCVHEVGHLIVDSDIGHVIADQEEISDNGSSVGTGRWLLDTAGAVLAIYQGESSAASSAQLPSLSDRNLLALVFDEPQGSSVFRDVSGNNNGAECRSGSPCVGAGSSGVIGASFRFNGSNEFLTVRPNAGLQPGTGDFTLSAWVYPTEHKPLVRVMAKVTDFVANEEGFYFGTAFGRPFWHVGNGSTGMEVIDAKSLSLDAWHLIVGTWESSTSTGTLYVDGVKVASRVVPLPAIAPNGDFILGGRVGFPSETFAGSIDETGAWTRALGQAEIERLFLDQVSLTSR